MTMSKVDVLIVTALKEEYDAAREAGKAAQGRGSGIASWEERGKGTPTPYLFGEYIVDGKVCMMVALAHPTKQLV